MKILQDTREKNGWFFEGEIDAVVQVQKLNAGDYTLPGLENTVIIERKSSATELANNLVREFDRFCKEFERLPELCEKYIVCEFPYEEIEMYPNASGLPYKVKKRIRIRGGFLKSRIAILEERYHIKFIFNTNRQMAENTTIAILREHYDKKDF